MAISEDGISWDKIENNPVLDIRNDSWDSSYIAANGSAVVFQDKIYYFYHGINTDTETSAIGLAISDDAEKFEERTETPVLSGGGAIRVGLCRGCRSIRDIFKWQIVYVLSRTK